MKISEDNLYHFTEKKDNLKSIIENGFIPFFGQEIVHLDDFGNYPIRVESFPRVCFTDLSLELIENHKSRYGKYGIGMKKDWAIRNGMNPILYIQKNSAIGATLSMLIERIFELHENFRKEEKINPSQELVLQGFLKLNDMFGRFAKQYEIDSDSKYIQINDEVINREIGRFYDEREWRYVPYQYKVSDLSTSLASIANKEELDKVSKMYSLQFDINDIVAVVLPEDDNESEEYLLSILCEKFKINLQEMKSKIIILKS